MEKLTIYLDLCKWEYLELFDYLVILLHEVYILPLYYHIFP